MKNSISLFVLLFVSAWCAAQSSEVQNTIVYALPKATLVIEVETEKTTFVPGVFYQYAGRYLSIKDVVTEEKTYYTLKDIHVKTEAIPDPNRTYSVVCNDKKTAWYNISINEKGILCGINVPCEPQLQLKKDVIICKQSPKEPLSLIPLSEEQMLAGSTAKLAEGTARQIYRIRENRMELLTGDAAHFPSDGSSFAMLLEEMEKMERELTELFTGKTIRKTETHTINYIPENPSESNILFRLSTLNGVVPVTDLSGAPYYISIATSTMPLETPVQEDVKKPLNPIIRTIYPAVSHVSIDDGRASCFSENFTIPQFGQIVVLNENILRNKDVKVRVNPETGRLLGIE